MQCIDFVLTGRQREDFSEWRTDLLWHLRILMDPVIAEIGQRLAAAAIERDWAAAHATLAPWLQASISVDGVRQFFEDDYQRLLELKYKSSSRIGALERLVWQGYRRLRRLYPGVFAILS